MPFERAFDQLGELREAQEVQPLIKVLNQLQTAISDTKDYFIEVRAKFSEISGIPPEKELAQLVIGACMEGLSAIRETSHQLQEYKALLQSKRRLPKSREELYYADISSKDVIRQTQYIIKKINEHLDELQE